MVPIPGNVFPRMLDVPLPMVAKADGVWIEDNTGQRYLDASGGAVVVNVGHGRREIALAVEKQLHDYYYAHPTMWTNPVVEKLAQKLTAKAPPGIGRYYFVSSGSEAIETAIKMARQIQLAYGRTERFHLIARWKSYHGLTLGALSATGRTVFRQPYAPMLSEVSHIPPPYCLRCHYGLSYPACELRCALALEDELQNLGPETVTAFLAETVSGGTLAAYPPPQEYFGIIRNICDKYEVLLILDEVMCGMGRTGRYFACEHYQVTPDIMTIGKGISGGALPLGAVGVQSSHFDMIREKLGAFVHGGTFSHHPVTAAAGLAVLDILEKEKLVHRVAKMGPNLGKLLIERLADHPNVGHIRGIGFLWGIELVSEKTTLKPFARSQKITEAVWQAIFNRKVIVYKSIGLAGTDGDALLVAPPFIITKEEMELVVDTIRAGLDEVLPAA